MSGIDVLKEYGQLELVKTLLEKSQNESLELMERVEAQRQYSEITAAAAIESAKRSIGQPTPAKFMWVNGARVRVK